MLKRSVILLLSLLVMTTSIKANEVIKVVTEDWPPYNYALPNGQVGGLTIE